MVQNISAWSDMVDLAREQLQRAPTVEKKSAETGAGTPPPEVVKAAQQFESFFVGYVMDMAFKAVPKSDLFGGQSERDMYHSMYVQEMVKGATQNGHGMGISDMLLKQYQHQAHPTGPNALSAATRSLEADGMVMTGASMAGHGMTGAAAPALSFATPEARLTSAYGERPDPFTGQAKFHDGVDIALPMRTPIRAAKDGIVAFSGWKGGYGNAVVIEHPGNMTTLYGHNDEHIVKVGDVVKRGQVIGYSGDTGHSTGPHLHFEVTRDGQRIDPKSYVKIDAAI